MKKLWFLSVTAIISTSAIFFLLKENIEIKEGLGSCIENVQKQCGPIINYGVALENENARLNRKLAACICPEKLD